MFNDCDGVDPPCTALAPIDPDASSLALSSISSRRAGRPTGDDSALVTVSSGIVSSAIGQGAVQSRPRKFSTNRRAWSWYLHYCKAHKKIRLDEMSVLDALVHLQKKSKTGKKSVVYNVKRLKRRSNDSVSKNSLVLQAKLKTGKGNRYESKFSMTDFLEVAFGERDTDTRFHSTGNIAKHFNMSPATVRLMKTLVAASVIKKQIQVAASVFQLCRTHRPTTVAIRTAWDETAQDIQVKLLGAQDSSRSAWKIMVQKLTINIIWPSSSLSMDLVSQC